MPQRELPLSSQNKLSEWLKKNQPEMSPTLLFPNVTTDETNINIRAFLTRARAAYLSNTALSAAAFAATTCASLNSVKLIPGSDLIKFPREAWELVKKYIHDNIIAKQYPPFSREDLFEAFLNFVDQCASSDNFVKLTTNTFDEETFLAAYATHSEPFAVASSTNPGKNIAGLYAGNEPAASSAAPTEELQQIKLA